MTLWYTSRRERDTLARAAKVDAAAGELAGSLRDEYEIEAQTQHWDSRRAMPLR